MDIPEAPCSSTKNAPQHSIPGGSINARVIPEGPGPFPISSLQQWEASHSPPGCGRILHRQAAHDQARNRGRSPPRGQRRPFRSCCIEQNGRGAGEEQASRAGETAKGSGEILLERRSHEHNA